MFVVHCCLLFTVMFVHWFVVTVVCLLLCLFTVLFVVYCYVCLLFVKSCVHHASQLHASLEPMNQGMLFSFANRLEQKVENGESQQQSTTPSTRPRPLYDVPYMFDAREFLRKRLIGKKVKVTVDYIKPAQNNFPERMCCTVTREDV